MIDVIEQGNLPARAAELSARMVARLRDKLIPRDGGEPKRVNAIRSKGLMIGIELERPCGELVAQALQKGVLINVTAERVIRLLPPLILSDQEADHVVDTVAELVTAFAGDAAA